MKDYAQDKDLLREWFNKQYYSNRKILDVVNELIEYRKEPNSGDKVKRNLYETFVYMDETEWEEFYSEMKDRFGVEQ